MKKLLNIPMVLLLFGCLSGTGAVAQEESKPELFLNIRYFSQNNSFQYLQVKTQVKADNKLNAAPGMLVKLFLNEVTDENFIAQVKTDLKGDAKAVIPHRLKHQWTDTTVNKFIAVSAPTDLLEESTTEVEIGKAKILIDTLFADDTRQVTAQVLTYEDGHWVPGREIELKLGVRRLSGVLNIGEEESYTTDSLGYAAGEFQLDSLPGDEKGNIVLVAKIEEHDLYGNVAVEKTVPWGVYVEAENNFGERSLWATRDKAPVWLLLMAFSIVFLVWGVIIYLIFQIVKLIKLGKVKLKVDDSPKLETTATYHA